MNKENKEKVLILCTHNSARSQMAEGILKKIYGDRFEVYSAGTEPSRVNPFAISAMEELGIDISKNKSKSVDCFKDSSIDFVVTVCDSAKESCPTFTGAKHIIHKSFRDPSQFRGTNEEILSGFRKVRDEIQEWIKDEFRNY